MKQKFVADKGLTLETSASIYFHGGNLALINLIYTKVLQSQNSRNCASRFFFHDLFLFFVIAIAKTFARTL